MTLTKLLSTMLKRVAGGGEDRCVLDCTTSLQNGADTASRKITSVLRVKKEQNTSNLLINKEGATNAASRVCGTLVLKWLEVTLRKV